MKITTEDAVKNYVVHYLVSVDIQFKEGTEATIRGIRSHDIDLDCVDDCSIELVGVINNTVIENCFTKNNRIEHIHLVWKCRSCGNNGETKIIVHQDIPCDMRIRRYRVTKDIDECQEVMIVLEGFVK